MIKQILILILLPFLNLVNGEYYVGRGIHDITGPPVEANFMGYANPAQIGRGIHLRLYSRAFIFVNPANKTRFVFVSVDCGMISQIVKTEVSNKLKRIYKGLYNEQNVALSSTHSHSGPGGFHQYILFDVTSFGFINETYVAMTTGIVQSIVNAHNSIKKARIFMNSGELLDANINRSPSSYLANPLKERQRYKYDVDKEMTVLKIVDAADSTNELGMISWFAVHGTSMNNTNSLVSGDNKGYASMLFERYKNGNNTRPGQGKFVAAFAQSNLGDVSPNIKGPHCIDTGLPCDVVTSTCNGRSQKCIAFGPGRDMFESTQIIGERQFRKALELYKSAATEVTGVVGYKHQFINMTDITVLTVNGTWGRTCKPAMGYSFAAGTTDGPGMFDFKQGTTNSNPFWNLIRDFIKDPSPELVKCQYPKPILLATGEMTFPYTWQAEIVETQVLRLGQVMIVAVPGEFTTMSGRRVRDTIKKTLREEKLSENFTVIVAGLSNTYSDYIATYEEYGKQRYEAASTIHGPHTLDAYLSQFANLTRAMIRNNSLPSGPLPPFDDHVFEFLPPVIFDNPGLKRYFGQVVKQPSPIVKRSDSVEVTFVGANPRNGPKLGKSFLFVDRFDNETRSWNVAYTDSDWETKFHWTGISTLAVLFGESEVNISWNVPQNEVPGKYRIRYIGIAKHLLSRYENFTGTSNIFTVQ